MRLNVFCAKKMVAAFVLLGLLANINLLLAQNNGNNNNSGNSNQNSSSSNYSSSNSNSNSSNSGGGGSVTAPQTPSYLSEMSSSSNNISSIRSMNGATSSSNSGFIGGGNSTGFIGGTGTTSSSGRSSSSTRSMRSSYSNSGASRNANSMYGNSGMGNSMNSRNQVQPVYTLGFVPPKRDQQSISVPLARLMNRTQNTGRLGMVAFEMVNDTAILNGVVKSEYDQKVAENMARLRPGIAKIRSNIIVQSNESDQ